MAKPAPERARRVGLALGCWLLVAAPASAAPDVPAPHAAAAPETPDTRSPDPGAASRRGVFSFLLENDTFARTDRYYTNGARFAWQSLGPSPEGVTRLARLLAPLLPRGDAGWGVSFGQSFYTPRANESAFPPRNDRPYAGWLYGGASLFSQDARRLGLVSLSLGVIGPSAKGQQVQDLVHEILGVARSQAWQLQLGDVPAALLAVEQRWRWSWPVGDALEVGVVPAVGANLGNVQTAAAGALVLRLGRGLDGDFGTPRARPALSGIAPWKPPESFSWYLYASASGQAVAYDGTLQGRTGGYWRITRETLVGELSGGLQLGWPRVRATASWVVQSATFQTQSTPFQFGAVSLSFVF